MFAVNQKVGGLYIAQNKQKKHQYINESALCYLLRLTTTKGTIIHSACTYLLRNILLFPIRDLVYRVSCI